MNPREILGAGVEDKEIKEKGVLSWISSLTLLFTQMYLWNPTVSWKDWLGAVLTFYALILPTEKRRSRDRE